MPLIALKCPECGGDIQLDDAREFGFCMYCGCKVLLERPAPRAGRKTNLRSILVLASESIASKDWKSAKSKVEKALMADIDCPDAWYMKALIYGADGDEMGERRAEAKGKSLEGRSLGVMTYEDYSKLARKKVTFTLECGYTRLGSGAVLVIDDKSHQLGSRITVRLFPGEHRIYAYDETRGGSVRSSATGRFVVKSDCDFVVRSDARGLSVRRSARRIAGIPVLERDNGTSVERCAVFREAAQPPSPRAPKARGSPVARRPRPPGAAGARAAIPPWDF